MRVKITRIHPDARLPKYHSNGAAAFDIETIEEFTLKPGEVKLFRTGLVFQVPEGYFLQIAPRSSLPKNGLDQPNSIGVLDPDYCGPEDELRLVVRNFTDKEVKVEKYQRLMQGIFIEIPKIEWEEIDEKELKGKTRGGFGTTGK